MKKIILLVCLLLSNSVFASNYKIIIDAGSSGSRLHLFQYQAAALPDIKDIFSESTKPGLSSFEKNPADAGQSLKKLLDDALVQLQNQKINPQDVEINVLATAGMRLLPSDKQAAIYASVKNFIENNHYGFQIGNIATIPGKMEALYGWLDVNYLAHNFDATNSTIGTIDMGGASTQIAFVTDDTSKPDDEMTLTLAGKLYRIFAKSFLGLGQDQAREKMNLESTANTCYPAGYQLNPTTLGNFNLASCAPLYANLIEKNQVRQQILPLDNIHFVAFSGAFYTYNFLAADTHPTRANLETRILAVCTKSWEQLKKDYPQIGEKYLATYCANGVYMDDLFYSTYQLDDSQLKVISQVNDQDIDWTLGALLFSVITGR